MAGEVAPQVGNDHPTSMPTSAYTTSDGYMNVAAAGKAIWVRLCEAVRRPDLLEHPDYKDAVSRAKNRKGLNAELDKILSVKTSAEWVEILNAAGVPCGPIYTMDQVFADPQVKHMGISAPVKHPRLGTLNILAQAVKLSRTPASMAAASPERGGHTAEILQEAGYDAGAIEQFKAKGII
jgi:formyl-CoA transferase